MTTILNNQKRLTALGIDVGVLDGKAGQKYHDGVAAALDRLKVPEPANPIDNETPVSGQPIATRVISEIIIHCTATPEGRTVSVETIRGWHKAQGWKDIGYHYVVLLNGSVEAGRSEAQIGSHVAGHNTGTLGVVYVGGLAKDGKTAKDTRTPAQKAALIATVKALIAKYPTIKKVTGHNQYAAKACPSFLVTNDPLGKLL